MTTTYKLTGANDSTSRIGDRHAASPLWLIQGVAYTQSEHIAEHARGRGYDVIEVEEIPSEYLEQAARLNAFPGIAVNAGGADGADPDQKYMITSPDGHTPVDIRDIITGRVTA